MLRWLSYQGVLTTVGCLGLGLLGLGCSEGTGTGMEEEPPDEPGPGPSNNGGTPGAGGDTSTPSTGGTGGTPAPVEEPEGVELIDVTAADPIFNDFVPAAPRQSLNLDPGTSLAPDQDEGNPAPSLRITVPFTDYNQYLEVEFAVPAELADVAGGTLRLPVMYDAGASQEAACPSGIKFYVKTGDVFSYGERLSAATQTGWENTPVPGVWRNLDFDMSNPVLDAAAQATFDASDVRVVGVAFDTGDCGGMYTTQPSESDTPPIEATYFIDTIEFIPPAEAN